MSHRKSQALTAQFPFTHKMLLPLDLLPLLHTPHCLKGLTQPQMYEDTTQDASVTTSKALILAIPLMGKWFHMCVLVAEPPVTLHEIPPWQTQWSHISELQTDCKPLVVLNRAHCCWCRCVPVVLEWLTEALFHLLTHRLKIFVPMFSLLIKLQLHYPSASTALFATAGDCRQLIFSPSLPCIENVQLIRLRKVCSLRVTFSVTPPF